MISQYFTGLESKFKSYISTLLPCGSFWDVKIVKWGVLKGLGKLRINIAPRRIRKSKRGMRACFLLVD
jgi:hypothetical protein